MINDVITQGLVVFKMLGGGRGRARLTHEPSMSKVEFDLVDLCKGRDGKEHHGIISWLGAYSPDLTMWCEDGAPGGKGRHKLGSVRDAMWLLRYLSRRYAVIYTMQVYADFIDRETLVRLGPGSVEEYVDEEHEKILKTCGFIEIAPDTLAGSTKNDSLAYIHYVNGNAHYWILQKDANDPDDEENEVLPQSQAFGMVWLGEGHRPELGYVSIPQILASGAKLDFDWQPVAVSQIRLGLNNSSTFQEN